MALISDKCTANIVTVSVISNNFLILIEAAFHFASFGRRLKRLIIF